MQDLEKSVFAHLAYPYFVLRQLFDLHGPQWLVTEHDGQLGGYLLTALSCDGTAWLLGLAVAEDCRGLGYGRTLLETTLEHCRAEGADEVRVTVRSGNLAAQHLYKKVGFIWTKHETKYLGPNEPRDILVCRL
ncbi:N-acetyltransferase [Nocardia sp. SYP-A9097]|uniref:GNAT family N-acetyltransferase n=1 Tax=Nocardia sp. SYP-A9097 TaxID=2663237 RepID=UPI0018911FCE|nr:GNAT family N-acetyltransferase [Nocardia sp. SYP-A9097]